MAKVKFYLQVNFLLLAVFNGLLAVLPTCLLRVALLRLFFKVSWRAAVHRRVRITSFMGPLTIGDHAVIGPGCLLDNRRGLVIEANANLTNSVRIYTLGHALDDPDRMTAGAAVTIGQGAFLFTGCAVMPGVTVGRSSALAAFSVLTRSTGECEFWAGNPASLKKKIVPRSERPNDYRYLMAL